MTPSPGSLDELLERAAPRSAAGDPSVRDALYAVVDQTRPRRRTRRRTIAVASALASVLLAGGAVGAVAATGVWNWSIDEPDGVTTAHLPLNRGECTLRVQISPDMNTPEDAPEVVAARQIAAGITEDTFTDAEIQAALDEIIAQSEWTDENPRPSDADLERVAFGAAAHKRISAEVKARGLSPYTWGTSHEAHCEGEDE